METPEKRVRYDLSSIRHSPLDDLPLWDAQAAVWLTLGALAFAVLGAYTFMVYVSVPLEPYCEICSIAAPFAGLVSLTLVGCTGGVALQLYARREAFVSSSRRLRFTLCLLGGLLGLLWIVVVLRS